MSFPPVVCHGITIDVIVLMLDWSEREEFSLTPLTDWRLPRMLHSKGMGLIEGACPAALAAGYDDVGTDPQGMDHMEGPVDWSALIPDAMWSEVLGE